MRKHADTRPLNVPVNVEKRLGISTSDYLENQKQGLKWCSGCKMWQPKSEFAAWCESPDGLQRWCKAKQKEYRDAHK